MPCLMHTCIDDSSSLQNHCLQILPPVAQLRIAFCPHACAVTGYDMEVNRWQYVAFMAVHSGAASSYRMGMDAVTRERYLLICRAADTPHALQHKLVL